MLHCINHLGDWSWAESLLMPCVCGFAVISGWFGVKCSFKRIAKLYIVQASCGVVIYLLNKIDGGGGRDSHL